MTTPQPDIKNHKTQTNRSVLTNLDLGETIKLRNHQTFGYSPQHPLVLQFPRMFLWHKVIHNRTTSLQYRI